MKDSVKLFNNQVELLGNLKAAVIGSDRKGKKKKFS